jgi:hypothetical protein
VTIPLHSRIFLGAIHKPTNPISANTTPASRTLYQGVAVVGSLPPLAVLRPTTTLTTEVDVTVVSPPLPVAVAVFVVVAPSLCVAV